MSSSVHGVRLDAGLQLWLPEGIRFKLDERWGRVRSGLADRLLYRPHALYAWVLWADPPHAALRRCQAGNRGGGCAARRVISRDCLPGPSSWCLDPRPRTTEGRGTLERPHA